jgi:hypothetical protein
MALPVNSLAVHLTLQSIDNKSESFLPGPPIIKLLSPLIIIADNTPSLFGLGLIYFLPAFLMPAFGRFISSKKSLKHFTLKVLALLFSAVYILFVLIASIVILFTYSTPIPYCFLIISCSVWAGWHLSGKFRLDQLLAARFRKNQSI